MLGIIENMSYFVCPKCGERSDIFGHGGAEHEAEKLGVPFLGGVPLHMDIRATSDSGQPITATAPDSLHAQIYREIAARTWAELQAAQGTARGTAQADGLAQRRQPQRRVRRGKGLRSQRRDAARNEPIGRGAGPLGG